MNGSRWKLIYRLNFSMEPVLVRLYKREDSIYYEDEFISKDKLLFNWTKTTDVADRPLSGDQIFESDEFSEIIDLVTSLKDPILSKEFLTLVV